MSHQKKTASYWSGFDTAWYWSIPSPLRVVEEDLAIYADESGRWRGAVGAPRVLVLGSTPGFHALPWPEGTDVLAVDKSAYMLEHLWPGAADTTLCADWTSLSLPRASRDIALTDLGLNLVEYPGPMAAVAAALGHMIAPGGLFIIRHLSEAGAPEDYDTVMAEFLSGKVENSSVLKMRLAVALAGARGQVRLGDIWERYDRGVNDRLELPQLTGWSDGELAKIEAYRNAEEVYYLPDPEALESLFCDVENGFELVSQRTPTYAMHEHVRILTFRKL